MTTGVETVAPDDDAGEVLGRLARAAFDGFPVAEGRLVGVVTQRDLVGLFQTENRTLWIPVGFPPSWRRSPTPSTSRGTTSTSGSIWSGTLASRSGR